MRLLRVVGAVGLVGTLAVPAGSATADGMADTGHFTFTEHFVVSPGETASCPFPIVIDLVGRRNFQVLFDKNGDPVRVRVHSVWQGTGSANGKSVVEHAAQTETDDLVDGSVVLRGGIHDQSLFGGVVIHDVGILRLAPDGSIVFEAGVHQGVHGDTAELCEALSP